MAEIRDSAFVVSQVGSSWQVGDKAIVRSVQLADFVAALAFVNEVGRIAEELNHHPDIDIRWNTVTLTCSTHDAGGLTDYDIELSQRIDVLVEQFA
jgi:4a-hydroxytetrahydrobiopterin dehydratase